MPVVVHARKPACWSVRLIVFGRFISMRAFRLLLCRGFFLSSWEGSAGALLRFPQRVGDGVHVVVRRGHFG